MHISIETALERSKTDLLQTKTLTQFYGKFRNPNFLALLFPTDFRIKALWLCGFAANLKLMLIVTCGFRNYLATKKRDNASQS